MLHILHCSDLHFGPPYLPRVGEAVQRLAAELQLDSIVVSGDFTQRATQEQFIQAKEFLDRLPDVPKIVVPGNHDVPLYRVVERLNDPLRNYREIIEDRLDYTVELEGATIVALNSTAPKSSISNGRIFPEQLDFCKQAFIDLPEKTLKIVVAHHHFAPAPDYERDSTMPKAKRAIDIFVDLKVDMIMGGHLHRAYIGNTLDLYAGRNRDRGIIIVQSGTTTSYRGRGREKEKNSLNLLRVDSRMIQITHYIYFHEHDRFEPVSRHSFPRPGMRFYEQT
ncbi:metallophosphoesterase family protein [Rubinisphaera italica]|uniref:Cyclic 3',5'-adenosine monophosphate phosphodiesterase n=1 Tax=Rubinisphaera italica TaxID=2527969 RepID=A0A5C5XFF1_9PLAN|nr:metallophosphoesterase family protein [Rubinisphaera italica]TWT60602.1 cyclic 3',5'-adenosine monophosphate phosphodiesterase [Rubinisphaera italica]